MSRRGYRGLRVQLWAERAKVCFTSSTARTHGDARRIKMGISPFALVVSPMTEMVYVVMGGNNEVWVVDPDRQTV